MVLSYIIGKPAGRVVKIERIKLVAGGCQLIAVGIFVAAIIALLFNPLINATLNTHVMGGIGFAFFELLALRIMGYIPTDKED